MMRRMSPRIETRKRSHMHMMTTADAPDILRRNMTQRLTTGLLVCSLVFCGVSQAGPLDAVVNQYLQISNSRTPYGVTDGNPSAATAMIADDAFTHFGLTQVQPTSDSKWDVGFDSSYKLINTSPVHSNQFNVDPYGSLRFGDKVALTLSMPMEYRDTHSLIAYLFALNAGLSFDIIPHRAEGLSWTFTPWGNALGVGASSDLAQGGFLAGGGFANNLTYATGPWKFSLGDQIGYEWGAPIGYGKRIDFKQNVSQFIVKNGVRAEYDFSKWLYADASLTYTNMLKDSFTDNYFSPSVGVGFRFGHGCDLRVSYLGDYAPHYSANGIGVSFQIAF